MPQNADSDASVMASIKTLADVLGEELHSSVTAVETAVATLLAAARSFNVYAGQLERAVQTPELPEAWKPEYELTARRWRVFGTTLELTAGVMRGMMRDHEERIGGDLDTTASYPPSARSAFTTDGPADPAEYLPVPERTDDLRGERDS